MKVPGGILGLIILYWILYRDTKPGIQDIGYRIKNTGYRTQDTGNRTQDTGYRIQGTGYRIHDTECVVL